MFFPLVPKSLTLNDRGCVKMADPRNLCGIAQVFVFQCLERPLSSVLVW